MIKINENVTKEFLESRYIAYPDGRVYSKHFHKFLKPTYNHDGYIRFHIQVIENGKSVSRLISAHRIIALLLIPNPENKPYINHKNGNKQDNRVENLEWITQKENIAYGISTRYS